MKNDLEGREIVWTSTMTYKIVLGLILAGLLSACSSSKVVPTKDVCTVERHFKDHIYQVKINGEPINKHWYIKEDAIEIVQTLAKDNKCMKWQ